MQVQKENSPKTVRTRPAGLRRGAEKTRGSPKRSRKGKMKGKGSVKRTRKGKGRIRKARRRRNRETRPGTPVSSLMQVQKENSPKTVRTRPAGLRRGAEKEKTRKRKREHHSHRNQLPGLYKKQYYRSKGSRVFTQKSASRPVQKQYYRSKGSRVVGVECSH